MTIKHSATLLASAGLVAAIALSQSVFATPHGTPASDKAMAGHSVGSKELRHAIMSGHDMRMPMSGNADKDFAMMMTMHHQQAIDMINVLAKHGQSPELKAMAMKMKAAQTEEIKQLARFAGPMDRTRMMDHGKMKMDHAKMAATEFAVLDKNKDGMVSRSEVAASHPLNQHFGMLDGNNDGSLSKAEFAKHHGM